MMIKITRITLLLKKKVKSTNSNSSKIARALLMTKKRHHLHPLQTRMTKKTKRRLMNQAIKT